MHSGQRNHSQVQWGGRNERKEFPNLLKFLSGPSDRPHYTRSLKHFPLGFFFFLRPCSVGQAGRQAVIQEEEEEDEKNRF